MLPMIKFGFGLRVLTIAWVVALLSSTAIAAPTFVLVDEFQVNRAGGPTPIFDDPFSSNTTLVGGSGAFQQASVPFTGGGVADYFVRGTIPQTIANNGQATLNVQFGIVQSQPQPFIGKIQEVGAILQTGTDPLGVHALTPSVSFTTKVLFDLSEPTTTLGTYNSTLTNRVTANSFMANQLELRVRDCAPGMGLCGTASGPTLQFVFSDHLNNTNTLIGAMTPTPADLANPQLLMVFSKPANSDAITAMVSFGTSNTLDDFVGTPMASLGTTTAATDVYTAANQFVLPGFEAFDPVAAPEAPSLLLLYSGLLGLAGLAKWRRRSQ